VTFSENLDLERQLAQIEPANVYWSSGVGRRSARPDFPSPERNGSTPPWFRPN